MTRGAWTRAPRPGQAGGRTWCRHHSPFLTLLFSALALSTVDSVHSTSRSSLQKSVTYPHIERQEASRKEARSSATAKAASAPQIFLHGNSVLVGPIRVYLIYYGNWNKASPVIENFVKSLSSSAKTPKGKGVNRASDWWNITRQYYNLKGQRVGQVVYGGRAFDKYSQGKDLTNKVGSVVYGLVKKKKLPVDNNAVYMVLPTADVKETPDGGFCAGTFPFPPGVPPVGYCGWHNVLYTPETGNLAYAFIGNANQCVQRCGHLEGKRTTPNGDVGIDAMVNVLAHELAEASTDFDTQNGWYTDDGQENSDLCNRQWGKVSMSSRGHDSYVYNLVGEGGMRWLVQLQWDLKSASCKMQMSTK